MNKLSYNEKSDIWSLGCVLYEMATLRPPFLASNQRELAMKIRMGQFSRLPSRYSSELGRLLDKMLSVEVIFAIQYSVGRALSKLLPVFIDLAKVHVIVLQPIIVYHNLSIRIFCNKERSNVFTILKWVL